MKSLPISRQSILSSAAIKEFLKEISIFSELSDEELDLLVEVSIEKRYAAGERIIQKEKDEPEASISIIRSGRVRVVLEKEGSTDVHLSTLNQREFFGELSLFDGNPRSATVIAEQDTEVIEIKRERFLGEICRKPEIALKVLGEMAMRVRRSDERIRDLANRVSNQAQPKLEKVLSTQLEAAKTIYAKTEDRASRTLCDVEQSWKTLTRFVSIILGVIAVVGSLLAYFGFKTFQDVQATARKITVAKKDAETSVKEITLLKDEARNAVVVNEILLSIGMLRQDLRLGENVDESNREQVRKLAINFGPAEDKLYRNYLKVYNEIEPNVLAEAAAAYVELMIRTGYALTSERMRVVVGALVHVLRQVDRKKWRMKLKIRDMLIELGTANGGIYRGDMVACLKSVVRNQNNPDDVRYDIALVMAKLGLRSEAARTVLLNSMHLENDPWIRFAAATRLVMMDEPEAWKMLSWGIAQPGKVGFVAAYMLGELGREELLARRVRDRLNLTKDGDGLLAIASRIQQGLDDVDAETRREINPYIKKYAQLIMQDLRSVRSRRPDDYIVTSKRSPVVR